jgi:hypothetical protein
MSARITARKLLSFLLLFILYYLPACKCKNQVHSNNDVRIHIAIMDGTGSSSVWDTTYMKKAFDTSMNIIAVPVCTIQSASNISDDPSVPGSSKCSLKMQVTSEYVDAEIERKSRKDD